MPIHTPRKQNRRVFQYDPMKIFVLIISAKIYCKFPGKLDTGIFNQFNDAILTGKIIFLANKSRLRKPNLN